jgi:hypothetical protein
MPSLSHDSNWPGGLCGGVGTQALQVCYVVKLGMFYCNYSASMASREL